MNQYDKMLAIREAMLRDYKRGIIPSAFNRYFEWKLGICRLEDITLEEAYNMIDEADNILETLYNKHPHPFSNISIYVNNNVWQNYEGFDEDKYIVAYLEAIQGELSSLASGGFFQN